MPSLLVEFPATLKEHINIEILPKELTYTQKEVASKVFISGKLGESEGFFKNIESSFKEVTNLNNNIEFKLEVTHLDQWVDRMRKGKGCFTQDTQRCWCGSMGPDSREISILIPSSYMSSGKF